MGDILLLLLHHHRFGPEKFLPDLALVVLYGRWAKQTDSRVNQRQQVVWNNCRRRHHRRRSGVNQAASVDTTKSEQVAAATFSSHTSTATDGEMTDGGGPGTHNGGNIVALLPLLTKCCVHIFVHLRTCGQLSNELIIVHGECVHISCHHSSLRPADQKKNPQKECRNQNQNQTHLPYEILNSLLECNSVRLVDENHWPAQNCLTNSSEQFAQSRRHVINNLLGSLVCF